MFGALTKMYKDRKYGTPVVVVSGLPRSGTSMTMKMLQAGGMPLYADHLRKADVDNPKGYFESERVKNLLEEKDKSWVREARGKAVKVISHLLQELPDDCSYRVLFMNRSIDEVFASQNKMLVRRGEPVPEDQQKLKESFERHLRIVRRWLKSQPNFTTMEIHYVQVLEDPAGHARRIRDFIGVELDVDAMARAVDPSLYRNRELFLKSGGAGAQEPR